jgi:hypothetical protein
MKVNEHLVKLPDGPSVSLKFPEYRSADVLASHDCMEQIAAQIQGVLRSNKSEPYDEFDHFSSKEYKATFELLWSPLQYLITIAQSHDDPEEVLGGAITLTGTVDDAQALTALEYLCLVRPDTGMPFMRLIIDVACSAPEHIAKGE